MTTRPRSKLLFLLALAFGMLVGCVGTPDTETEESTVTKDSSLFVNPSSIWPSLEIPVCWVNATAGDAEAMGWTRDAVEKSWMAVSQVRFVGWGACDGTLKGVRIRISDERPHSIIGKWANSVTTPDTMTLNFAFGGWDLFGIPITGWSPSCRNDRENCIRLIAIHEFGHALGFEHEQNRPDTPDWCEKDEGQFSGEVIGPWDEASVMNYCNPKWNGDGILSATDIQGAEEIYGVGLSSAWCGELDTWYDSITKDVPLTSCDGRFHLVLQGDGNLVLYEGGTMTWSDTGTVTSYVGGTPLWGTNTVGSNASVAVMQDDGNFVLYDPTGRALWASNTAGYPHSRLVVQADGNVVVYRYNGEPLWSSDTCCH